MQKVNEKHCLNKHLILVILFNFDIYFKDSNKEHLLNIKEISLIIPIIFKKTFILVLFISISFK